MPVISNTLPILNLAIIDRLALLREQFGEVYVPPAVQDEFKADSDFPGAGAIRQAFADGWIQIVNLDSDHTAQALKRDLDNGEAEAIALALQLGIETILIDEHDGREAARAMGLKPVGVLGILLRAKRLGAIDSVGEAMRALQSAAGFYINEDLFAKILNAAEER